MRSLTAFLALVLAFAAVSLTVAQTKSDAASQEKSEQPIEVTSLLGQKLRRMEFSNDKLATLKKQLAIAKEAIKDLIDNDPIEYKFRSRYP